jgi:hypothetical protein
MDRYNRSFFGMDKSEKGEWVAYPVFELERALLEELAASRLDMIQARNTEIIRMKKESEESHIKYQGLLDSMNNQNISLQGFVSSKDNTIYNLDEIIKILQSKSKFTDLKHDTFIFSVVLNGVFILYNTINAFGGIL